MFRNNENKKWFVMIVAIVVCFAVVGTALKADGLLAACGRNNCGQCVVSAKVDNEVEKGTYERILESFSATPAAFIENVGQIKDASVRYVFYGSGANIFHTTNGPVFQLFKKEKISDDEPSSEKKGELPEDRMSRREGEDFATRSCTFSASFSGAKHVKPVGADGHQAKVNYFIGNDQNKWRTGVSTYATVIYRQLYEGIDLHTFGRRSHLKYEFHVAPGADYTQITIAYEGIDGLTIAPNGTMHISMPFGELVDEAPYIYQVIDGRRVEIDGRYRLVGPSSYTFELTGPVDPARELVIDPDLAWTTYLGGSGYDYGGGIAADTSGNVLVVGYTESTNFSGAANALNGTKDVFVAKVSSNGGLLWATYLGGGSSDYGSDIAVDSSGNLLVVGRTWSNDFPAAKNDYYYDGDVLVAKLNAGGTLLWSRYLGGNGKNYGYAIAIDGSDNAVVTGKTEMHSSFEGDYKSGDEGNYCPFAAKVSPSGVVVWARDISGGTWDSKARDIAIDGSGNILIVGCGKAAFFPNPTNEYQGGVLDGFVLKLNSSGTPLWSTFLGGSGDDYAWGIDVDSAGNALVAGDTTSSDFNAPAVNTYNGSFDAFVAKVDSSGTPLWVSFLGGSDSEDLYGIALNSSGNALVTGRTWSDDVVGADNTFKGGDTDAIVAEVSSDGTLQWATYIGTSDNEYGRNIALDLLNNILVIGNDESTDDVFVAKISLITSELLSIEISGPTYIDETLGEQYTCTAYFDDGSTQDVTSGTSWSENSDYASISGSGYLTTTEVDSDQPCRITATYAAKTDTHDVTIGDAGITTITIMPDATDTADYPMFTEWHDSRTQVIYLASEIGTERTIAALALNVETVPGQPMNNWTIRMKHTSMSSYPHGAGSLDSTGWTVVYQQDETAGSTGWRTFTFSTPFGYNGTDNLLVDFSHNNDSYSRSGWCMGSLPGTGEGRVAVAFSDSDDGDPLNWSGTDEPDAWWYEMVPSVRLSLAQAVTGIEISGPAQVDKNSGAQYTCTAHYSDGSTSTVTDSATWSEDSTYASIDSSGYLTTTSVTSDQPCTITASYGGKSDTHGVIIKDSSDISLQKCKVKAGKTVGEDSIRVSGRIDVTTDEFDNADTIYVDIYSDSDDYPIYSESIDRRLFNGGKKKGRYRHKHKVKKHQPGAITLFKFNLKSDKFLLKAKNIDLTGLCCPLSVKIRIGDYFGIGEAGEGIVNGKKPIPTCQR